MTTTLPQQTMLSSHNVAERRVAAEQLAKMGGDALSAVVELIRACGDTDEEVREWVVSALEDIGDPESEQISSLTQLLDDACRDVVYWSVTILARSTSAAAPAVPRLITTLERHSDSSVRQRAAWALGKIGVPASSALKSLRCAAASDDPRLSRTASRSIAQIDANR